ncbi:phage minor head protein [Moritella viscosa]|uniref:Head morphogenesis protein SPP1 gp7 n=1 Tax=Moritella viscosa TaxID=80854 RepID=A0ABY1HCJ1_9GAMM|nr:phage minor head protein [Moritella viscosa]CED61145.1 bacteriophage Mu-like gp30 protein [Moritella viscosa]SGY85123.1 Head morphogenesis protein SPP1 gp7 [Moritella viscosa]SGY87309.1 Head morphogenesis protein SPP1 gp7 [Moritella viscosa]SHN99472.1 Head morphogenesis protein SPP1 gp7 [Moritella viscosa]SHO20114.1 Head morphogenesis protein SPP1 gp7 [Moritella viscosa]
MPDAPKLIPQDALNYLTKKKLTPGFNYQDVWQREHNNAFTVAKMMQLDMLADTRNALEQALREGKTFQQFAKSLKPTLVAQGWWGEKSLVDPQTGTARAVQLGSDARLKTIYDTNMKTARAAGKWARIERSRESHPYLLYELGPSLEHRPEHSAWKGLLLPVDDPFWQTHFPPNGWGCKCRVRQVSQREAERLKGDSQILTQAPTIKTREWVNKRTGEVQQVPVGIDPGWNYNMGIDRKAQITKQTQNKETYTKQKLGTAASPAPLHEFTNDSDPQRYLELGAKQTAQLLNETDSSGTKLANVLVDAIASPEKRADAAQQFQQALLRQLSLARNISTSANIATRGKGATAVRQASLRYPDDWTKAADELGPLYVSYTSTRGWAVTLTSDRAKVDSFGWAYKKLGKDSTGAPRKWPKGSGFIRTDESSTAAHEYAHRLQKAIPELDTLFNRIHQRRTQGDKLERLRDLTGLNYGLKEVTRKDGYYNVYMGKEYASSPDGHKAAEVMPMALEPLLGTMDTRNVARLFALMQKDPDMLETVIGLLFHYRP